METLDVLGIYLLGFKCEQITWDSINAVICTGGKNRRRIVFVEDAAPAEQEDSHLNNVIRLLDAPEVITQDNSVIIRYGENEFVHEMPALISCMLEPCERYAVALSPSALKVFSAYNDETILEMTPADGKKWCRFHINWRGDFFVALQTDGSIWLGDAIKQSLTMLHKGNAEMTASAFGAEKYIILGDQRGNITVYDFVQKSVLLRTPRRPIEFTAVYPASDKVGFVALRTESATAFFSQSQEILSASPLPAAVRASCPGMQFSELLIACADNILYRVKLDDNSISKICKTPKAIDAITCNNDAIFVHYTDGSAASLEQNALTDIPWKSKKSPLSLAISENGKTFCALFSDHVDIIDRNAKKEVRRIDIKGGVQLICGKEKTANQLIVLMADLRILSIDMRSGEISELNRIDLDYGRILSVAPAAKSFAFVPQFRKIFHRPQSHDGRNTDLRRFKLRRRRLL